MVIDISAVVTSLGGESDGERYQNAILGCAASFMSALTVFECRIVLHRRFGPKALVMRNLFF